MKVGDLVTSIRSLPGAHTSRALALIVGFDEDDDPIISYLVGDRTPHSVYRFNLQLLSSGQNLSED